MGPRVGKKRNSARGGTPLALGTSLFLETAMDLLVLERAPLGAIRNYLDTTECRLLPRGLPNILQLGTTPKSSEKALMAIPESCRVYSAFFGEMQTQNSNSINRGRAATAMRNLSIRINWL
jgi:hypothetical protein